MNERKKKWKIDRMKERRERMNERTKEHSLPAWVTVESPPKYSTFFFVETPNTPVVWRVWVPPTIFLSFVTVFFLPKMENPEPVFFFDALKKYKKN